MQSKAHIESLLCTRQCCWNVVSMNPLLLFDLKTFAEHLTNFWNGYLANNNECILWYFSLHGNVKKQNKKTTNSSFFLRYSCAQKITNRLTCSTLWEIEFVFTLWYLSSLSFKNKSKSARMFFGVIFSVGIMWLIYCIYNRSFLGVCIDQSLSFSMK